MNVIMGPLASLLLLLFAGDTCALFNGNPVSSSSDVPGVTGSLFMLGVALLACYMYLPFRQDPGIWAGILRSLSTFDLSR